MLERQYAEAEYVDMDTATVAMLVFELIDESEVILTSMLSVHWELVKEDSEKRQNDFQSESYDQLVSQMQAS